MVKQEQSDAWLEVKDIWKNSSQGEKINFQISELVNELKAKMSQFEKDAIKSDLNKVESSWTNYKRNVSQWEKDTVSKDLLKINALLKKFLKRLKRKNKS